MEERKNNGLVVQIIAFILFLVLVGPRVIGLVDDWREEVKAEERKEYYRKLMAAADQKISEQNWLEAQRLFQEADALGNTWNATVGYAQATFHVDGAQAALETLNGCPDEACENERQKLHSHLFNELLNGKPDQNNIGELWGHGLKVYSPACVTEKIVSSHLPATAQARAKVFGELARLLDANLDNAIDKSFESAGARTGYHSNPQAQVLGERIGQLSAKPTIETVIQLGAEGGTAAVHESARHLNRAACEKIEKQREKVSGAIRDAYIGERMMIGSLNSGVGSGPFGMAPMALSEKAYEEDLHELYHASAARALLKALNTK